MILKVLLFYSQFLVPFTTIWHSPLLFSKTVLLRHFWRLSIELENSCETVRHSFRDGGLDVQLDILDSLVKSQNLKNAYGTFSTGCRRAR